MLASHFSSLTSKMLSVSTSDHASVVSLNLFVALLCACIVIGHLLEENRWMNESITALLIVSLLELSIIWVKMVAKDVNAGGLADKLLHVGFNHINVSSLLTFLAIWLQGLGTGVVILLISRGKNSHLLVFSEDLFFIYLLPPIIFNAG